MDPIEKVRTIFFEPANFFRQVKNEKKYFPILMYFFVAYILSTLVSMIFQFRDIKSELMKSSQLASVFFAVVAVFMLLFVVVIAFIAPFIGAGISHLGIMIVGGVGKFFDTFKASTYASVLSPLYSIVLTVIGFLNPFNINNPVWPDFLNVYTFLWITVAIVSMVHVFYVECTGLSLYHKISKIRALVAILIIPVAMAVILMIIIILAIVLMFR